jgi:hypothetical protein
VSCVTAVWEATHIWSFAQRGNPTISGLVILAHHIIQGSQANLHVRVHHLLRVVLIPSEVEVLVCHFVMQRPRVRPRLNALSLRSRPSVLGVNERQKLVKDLQSLKVGRLVDV